MQFMIFTLISIFVIAIFSLIPKKLQIREYIFIWFITTILLLNFFGFAGNYFQLIMGPKQLESYFTLILFRSIILPAIFLIFFTVYFSFDKKWLSMIGLYIALVFMEVLSQVFGLYDYKDWNFGLSMISLFIFQFVTFFIFTWYKNQRGNKEFYA
jgi:hypothetical protein